MWDINDISSDESYALQAEREVWADLQRSEQEPPVAAPAPPSAPTVTVRFKRLRDGSWGLSGPETLLREGEGVVVSKRDGSTDVISVGAVLWSGDGKAISRIAR